MFGLGFGMVGQVLIVAVQNAVDRGRLGVAMAATSFSRGLGGAVGAALLGAVFASRVAGSTAPAAARADLIDGVQTVFIAAAPLAALALAAVLLLRGAAATRPRAHHTTTRNERTDMADSDGGNDRNRGPRDRSLRAGDGDREAFAAILREQHLEGRLDSDEFQERLDACMAAKTYADLDQLVADLPGGEPAGTAANRSPRVAAAAVAVPAAAAGVDRSDRDRHRPPPLVPDPAGGVLRDPPAGLALVGLGRLGLRPPPIVSQMIVSTGCVALVLVRAAPDATIALESAGSLRARWGKLASSYVASVQSFCRSCSHLRAGRVRGGSRRRAWA